MGLFSPGKTINPRFRLSFFGATLFRIALALLPYPELDAFLKRPYSLVITDWLPKPCSWHGLVSSDNRVPPYPDEYRPWIVERFRSDFWDDPAVGKEASIRRPTAGAIFYYDPALHPEAQGLHLVRRTIIRILPS